MIGLGLLGLVDEPPLLDALVGLAPLWILLIAALVLLVSDAFARSREPGFLRGLALLAVGLAFVASARQLGDPALDLGQFVLSSALVVDHLTVACDLVALLALAGVVGLARERGTTRETPRRAFGEREPLLLLAGVGALICIHAGDLLVVWLGVELLTIAALLTMFAGHDAVADPAKRNALLIQLVPGAVISCLILLGVALLYAAIGTTSLDGFGRATTQVFARWGAVQRWVSILDRFGAEIAQQDPAALQQAHNEIVRGVAPAALFLPGLLLVLGGVLTKLGLLPFARRRELVEESPLHVTALWSTLAVVALVAVLLRVFVGALHSPRLVNEPYGWTGALPSVALISGLWAALAAVRQRRLSRVVALLALVQLSLLILAVVAAANFHGHIGVGARYIAPESEILWAKLAGDEAYASVLILLATHVIAAVGCFAAIGASRGFRGPEVRMQHWAGMATRRPGLALGFAICLLSLVGLPPLAGFVAKLGVLRALVEHSAMRWMVVVVAFELALCAWVALRIIAAMYFGDETVSEPGERREPSPWPARIAAVAATLCVLLGVGGQRLLEFARLPAAGGSFEPGDPDRLDWLEDRRASWAIEDLRFADGPEDEAETEGAVEAVGETEGELTIEPGLESVVP
ncbi:NADH-quinone oxidoreductase subunit N [Enhygromyxa salina]|uniref:NADH-quinone oxidoreductase subunit N n=1 Tax=Enhygromyxa salina TaxID=215803 RepID=A0A2S9YAD9_9BACT|nr:proton-conducting transporter membrane subunit [Enhygromyxa salina]PRQ02069.1 NADH-quinone oxidoreductase subunit N [Enhygromyxa salina]